MLLQPADLTADVLAPYVGGQLEVQKLEESIHRGEIETIEIKDGKLVVRLAWNAKGIDFPPLPIPKGWVEDPGLDYTLTLEGASIQYSPTPDGVRRILIQTDNEILLLVPATAERKLPRSAVQPADAVNDPEESA